MADAPRLFLYSTNLYVKFLIQEQFREGRHFVWCSEHFDPTKLGAYNPQRQIPPSSNPAELYRRYKADYDSQDSHSHMINGQRASLKIRAGEWLEANEIDLETYQEIVFLVDKDRQSWRPVVYLIRRDLVEARLEAVPPSDRAGPGREYKIADLTRAEFELLEV